MISKILVVSSFSILFAQVALAVDPVTTTPACAKIVQDCEAQKYDPGMHRKDGMGLWVDCIGAIAHGKTVAGVSDTQAEAKTCLQAKRAERQSR